MKKRSKFSLSHYKLATMDMGKLVPVSWYEALPGDTIQHRTSAFVRVAPTLSPTMTPCRIEFRTYSVPLRLLWDNGKDDCWETFITGGPDGLDASVPPFFRIASGATVNPGSLLDYLGVPAGEPFASDVDISAFPVLAYNRIWSDYFRDQDLQEPVWDEPIAGGMHSTIGSNSATIGWALKNVCWGKDYYTVARPFEQKGPAVTIPVSLTTASGDPLISATTTVDSARSLFSTGSGIVLNHSGGTSDTDESWRGYYGTGTYKLSSTGYNNQSGAIPSSTSDLSTSPVPTMPLTQAPHSHTARTTVTWNGDANASGSITVDDIREAFGLQRMEEARALFGSRYVEYLRYLGVRSSDARLQRPEYLGGGSQPVQWSEVVQTGAGNTDPVGTLRGHGISAGRTKRWRRFFEEHCIVMTLAWIRPIAMYTQSLSRAWSRTLKEDYWQKELQHIGQQEVLNKEIYALGENPDGVFGYMDRYDEYRSVPSTASGLFRTSMDYWHLGRVFSGQPVLNSDFVSCNPSKRIFAEQTQHEFYCMFLHSVQARRLISRRGRPGGL